MKAFTLTELLIVIGLAALLALMVAPALTGARESAVSAHCKSNLRQIGQAFAVRVDVFPNAKNWPATPYALTPHEMLYRCPADVYKPNMAVVGDLYYQAAENYGGHRIPFERGALSPQGKRANHMQRGNGYAEFTFEEQADQNCIPWREREGYPRCPDISDNDGVFRVYDGFGNAPRVVQLMYYTCGADNRAYVGGKPMFGADVALLALRGRRLVIADFYTSYGMPENVNSPDLAPDTTILGD